jgi:hypothetical protein
LIVRPPKINTWVMPELVCLELYLDHVDRAPSTSAYRGQLAVTTMEDRSLTWCSSFSTDISITLLS